MATCYTDPPPIEPIDPHEEWRPIPGYEDCYRVSLFGRVESIRRVGTQGGLIAVSTRADGYPSVALVRHGKSAHHTVHVLVAAAFLGPRPPGMDVRHLDGDRMRPVISNLAYGTRSQNNHDKRRHGTDHNVNKTNCPQGHPYDDTNTVEYRGSRYCLACNADYKHNRRRVRWLAVDLLCDKGTAAQRLEDAELRKMLVENMEMSTKDLEAALKKLKQLLMTAKVTISWA